MGKINSKVKGRNGEAELARFLQKYGYDTHRGQQFSGGVDSPDVKGLPGRGCCWLAGHTYRVQARRESECPQGL